MHTYVNILSTFAYVTAKLFYTPDISLVTVCNNRLSLSIMLRLWKSYYLTIKLSRNITSLVQKIHELTAQSIQPITNPAI